MAKNQEKYDIPHIVYEEPQPGMNSNPIPFIEIQKDKKMPPVIFIFEYKHSGETEPGPNGEPVPIVDQIPHKFVDLELLKEKLTPEINDIVRMSIGMEPLSQAAVKGQKILDKVNKNIEASKIKQERN